MMTKKENLIRTITRRSPQWVPYRYDGSLTLLKPPIVVRPEEGGLDDWGVNWICTNTVEGSYPDGKPVIGIDSVDKLLAPATDFENVTSALSEQMRTLSGKDTLVLSYNELTLYQRAELLLGTNDLLIATELYPERVEKVLDVIALYQLRLTGAILRSGVSGVRFTDDWGAQESLFISPNQWRRFIKPRLQPLYELVRKCDAFVFHHSCGHIEEIVPDLIEIGVEVLDPCQPQANDIFQWKKKFGDRLSFMGGLDTQDYLSFADPADIRKKVTEVVSIMSERGGYIAAPSHTITIPEENRKAMIEAIGDFNRQKKPDRTAF